MVVESQYPQPKPTPAFQAVLAALSKVLLADEHSEGPAWELEWALRQWVDERLDDVYDEIGAIREYLLKEKGEA